MKKSITLLISFMLFIVSFSGTFVIFNDYFLLESNPILLTVGEDSFGIGLVYSSNSIKYVETKIGFLKIKKPSEKEFVDFSVILGTMYGVYASVGYENLNFPVSSQQMEFFVTNKISYITSQSKSFYALGPISLNSESVFLNQNNEFGYTFNRIFGKFQNLSGYLLKLDDINFVGYLFPLDVSLEQGILVGVGTESFNELYLNIGLRKFFKAGDFRSFGFLYVYVDKNDLNNLRYFGGLKILAPLKGDLMIWDGKFSFGINW